MKRLTVLLFALVLLVVAEDKEKFARKMIVKLGDDFEAKVTEVRSVSPDKRVGFGKTPPLYGISVVAPQAEYTVYCLNAAPTIGKTYTVVIDYLDGALSFLRLWPVEKKDLDLPSGQSARGRAYRMMVFRNVRNDPRLPPDLACDIKTETVSKQ